jgi:hypothetical protein
MFNVRPDAQSPWLFVEPPPANEVPGFRMKPDGSVRDTPPAAPSGASLAGLTGFTPLPRHPLHDAIDQIMMLYATLAPRPSDASGRQGSIGNMGSPTSGRPFSPYSPLSPLPAPVVSAPPTVTDGPPIATATGSPSGSGLRADPGAVLGPRP